jgi:hypothetical protein
MYYFGICLEELRDTSENLRQDSLSPYPHLSVELNPITTISITSCRAFYVANRMWYAPRAANFRRIFSAYTPRNF